MRIMAAILYLVVVVADEKVDNWSIKYSTDDVKILKHVINIGLQVKCCTVMFCCVAVVPIGSLQWVDNNLNELADDRFRSEHVVQ